MSSGSFHPGIAAMIRTTDSLKHALDELGGGAGLLTMHSQTPWRSTSFSGVRHTLVYAFDGVEAVAHGERLIDVLPEHAFDIPGQLVADATVNDVVHRLDPARLEATLELLLLDKG